MTGRLMDRTTIDEQRLSEALVRLLAHDLRAPMGPAILATSAIEEDPNAGEDVRALARMAGAQAARSARLIDAVLAAIRGPRAPVLRATDLFELGRRAADGYEALGGTATVEGVRAMAALDADQVRDALLDLMECAGGEGGTVRVTVSRDDAGVRVTLAGRDADGCAQGLTARVPQDWRSAMALGASALIRVNGGAVAATPGGTAVLFGGSG